MDTMNENIVVWNPHGFNAPNRGTAVRTMVDDVAASIVCMVESKLEEVSIFDITRVLGPKFDEFVALPAVRTAGESSWHGKAIRCRSCDRK
jgi:hypothetical protein